MAERKLKTTHQTNNKIISKAKEMMERLKTTGKEYNPAPKESKNGKVQK